MLYPTLNNAMDDLYLYWVDSCELGNERFVRAYVGVDSGSSSSENVYIVSGDDKGTFYGTGVSVIEDGSDCKIDEGSSTGATVTSANGNDDAAIETTTANYSLYNERGKDMGAPVVTEAAVDTWAVADGTITVVVAGTVPEFTFSDAKWVDVPSLLDQFGGIGRLVLSVMPIMVLASFLGLVAMGLIDYGRGMSQGGIAGAVGAAIIQLIVVIVLLEVLPTVIDAMVDANQSATGGSLSVNTQFSGIMGIIFAALPLLLIVGILGISGFMLFQRGRNFRQGGGFSFGG